MSAIAIVGKSGEGKSTSMGSIPELEIEGLNPKETFLINVTAGKDLPFRGWRKLYNSENKNYLETTDAKKIAELIANISSKAPNIKNIVVDDGKFIMSFEYMSRAKENGYNKFVDLGVNTKILIDAAKATRPDLKVYFMWHTEDNKEFGLKMKTVGNMIDQYLTLEGLFTIILYSKVEKGVGNKMKYEFVTNNDGKYPAKSPVGMFKDMYIKNDLGFVNKQIDDYYNG